MKSPSNSSNVRSFIHFKMTVRKDIFMRCSVPYKWPLWLFLSVKRIMLVECLKRHTLMKRPNDLIWWFTKLQPMSILCQPLRMFLTRLQKPVNHYWSDVRSTHQAMQDFHLYRSRVLAEITDAVIRVTMTRIWLPCTWNSVLPWPDNSCKCLLLLI